MERQSPPPRSFTEIEEILRRKLDHVTRIVFHGRGVEIFYDTPERCNEALQNFSSYFVRSTSHDADGKAIFIPKVLLFIFGWVFAADGGICFAKLSGAAAYIVGFPTEEKRDQVLAEHPPRLPGMRPAKEDNRAVWIPALDPAQALGAMKRLPVILPPVQETPPGYVVFSWKGPASRVQVTGTFFAQEADHWHELVDLTPLDGPGGPDRIWRASLGPRNVRTGKIVYKFVIDGRWRHNNGEATEPDGMGGFNNTREISPRRVRVVSPPPPVVRMVSPPPPPPPEGQQHPRKTDGQQNRKKKH
ncbi:hypothetical protein PAPYR_6562 [Paratrimastix pyriformis]|uniref:AMP-activated protein kinase glycogen-binding domain-containing protein n=1 Tax=Paratrimastix pyriformis TaxID=342808 RepID=A0ABQ8UGH8_9EUKA|nr:hypothetical protein PAPYR_6562 [Paratrimastix pyriformis]